MVYFGIGGSLGYVSQYLGIVMRLEGFWAEALVVAAAPLPEIAEPLVPRATSNPIPISISAETS
jgi:hypothetical protein